ncbi:MAG TPA: hypothetical protein IGS53_29085 [Leptolyngbyaceae cyanobacterium M33_DOE_097]|nr:hypothetical protein [Leptolyngbyaceae cyanobacterium M33_DOE_097]
MGSKDRQAYVRALRQQICYVQELRHQLRYANTPEEREAICNRIDFWLNYVPNK